MTTPAKIAPARPLESIVMSATARFENLVPSVLNTLPGALKYSIIFSPFTIKIVTSGKIITITHEDRNSIFNKKPIPKKSRKNRTTDIIKTGNAIVKDPPQEASLSVYSMKRDTSIPQIDKNGINDYVVFLIFIF